MHNKAASACRR